MSKRLTEEMVIARTKISDLGKIKRLNCWGSELVDVSLLRQMPSVEVLSLSINKINSLIDFQFCKRLEELYIRQNDIRDVNQILYLQALPNLKNLWLGENPCSNADGYRLAVIRALPQLQKLDNIQVTQDELRDAQRKGKILVHPEDYQEDSEEEYIPPPSPQRRKDQYAETEYIPSRESPSMRDETTEYDDIEGSEENYPREEGSEEDHGQSPTQQTSPPPRRDIPRRYTPEPEFTDRRSSNYDRESPTRNLQQQPQQQYCEKTSPTNSSFEETLSETTTNYRETKIVNSQSANCIKDYTNGEKYAPYHAGSEYSVPKAVEKRERYSCPAAAHRPPFTRRPVTRVSPTIQDIYTKPVTRNSNILSAVLCLVKELDYPSLEVVEMAVRCRMDELIE